MLVGKRIDELILVMIVILGAICPLAFGRLEGTIAIKEHRIIFALIVGLLVALLTYYPMTQVLPNPGNGNASSAAALLGLLVSKTLVYGIEGSVSQQGVFLTAFVFHHYAAIGGAFDAPVALPTGSSKVD